MSSLLPLNAAHNKGCPSAPGLPGCTAQPKLLISKPAGLSSLPKSSGTADWRERRPPAAGEPCLPHRCRGAAPRPSRGRGEPTSSARPGGSFSSSRAISRPGRPVTPRLSRDRPAAVRVRSCKHPPSSAGGHGFESQPRRLDRFGSAACSVRPSVRRRVKPEPPHFYKLLYAITLKLFLHSACLAALLFDS